MKSFLFLKNKILNRFLMILLASILLFAGGCSDSEVLQSETISETKTVETQSSKNEEEHINTENSDSNPGEEQSEIQIPNSENEAVGSGKQEPLAPNEIPPYSGSPFAALNNNIPNFGADELRSVGYESYSELDILGRTGVAVASVGKDTMPKEGEKRGSISSIKPSGWNQASYDHVSGKYLYNRCHLIGWQLSAENANKRNLLTGTKYLNVSGMLPFENMVSDYIKETGNHVAYRITPIYEGDNLVASGVAMEAYSVEDKGEGICFHVYCYNVQPGVRINYSDGSSFLESSSPNPAPSAPISTTSAPAATTTQAPAPVVPSEQTVLTTQTGKRYHSTKNCSGLSNAKAIFESTLQNAKNKGLTPCSKCY